MSDPTRQDLNGAQRKRPSDRTQLAWTFIAIGFVMPLPLRNTAEGLRPGVLHDVMAIASWAFGAFLIVGILLALSERDRAKYGKRPAEPEHGERR